MDRTKFYNVQTVVDGTTGESHEELDFLDNSLSRFKMTYGPTYYMIGDTDKLRPDAISSTVYESVGYWWLILFVNGVQDIITGLPVGSLLTVPNMLDIYDFSKNFKVR